MIQKINVQTGEEHFEPLDEDVLAERQAQFQAQKLSELEAQNKRNALLEKLGITEDEAKLLLG